MSQPETTSADQPLHVDSFGDCRVDSAMAALEGVAELPGSDQVVRYETVHRALQDTLATIEEG